MRLDVRDGDTVQGGHRLGADVGAGRTRRCPRGAAKLSAVVTVTGVGKAAAWRPIGGSRANPARWGTCRISYRVNERRMPATGLADLREAMRRVTQVSGIRFRYRGKSSAVPHRGYGGPGLNQIVVAWVYRRSRSGSACSTPASAAGGTSQSGNRLLTGYVIMNTQYTATADAGFGDGSPLGLVLMHELGHVVGLDHSPDRRQIMYGSSYLPASVGAPPTCAGCTRSGRAADDCRRTAAEPGACAHDRRRRAVRARGSACGRGPGICRGRRPRDVDRSGPYDDNGRQPLHRHRNRDQRGQRAGGVESAVRLRHGVADSEWQRLRGQLRVRVLTPVHVAEPRAGCVASGHRHGRRVRSRAVHHGRGGHRRRRLRLGE